MHRRSLGHQGRNLHRDVHEHHAAGKRLAGEGDAENDAELRESSPKLHGGRPKNSARLVLLDEMVQQRHKQVDLGESACVARRHPIFKRRREWPAETRGDEDSQRPVCITVSAVQPTKPGEQVVRGG